MTSRAINPLKNSIAMNYPAYRMPLNSPEFDPQKKGIYSGRLRLSFVKTVDEIASDEISEFTSIALPSYINLDLPGTIRFAQLRRGVSCSEVGQRLLAAEPIDAYVNGVICWAEKHNVDCEWYLDALHARIEFLAVATAYHQNLIKAVAMAKPFHQLLLDYSRDGEDAASMLERNELVGDLFRLLEVDIDNFTPELRIRHAVNLLKSKTETEITELEEAWRGEKLRGFEGDEDNLLDDALKMSYNFTFVVDVNDRNFNFEFRPWQFNEERRSSYRKLAQEHFARSLEAYLEEMEIEAVSKNHRKINLPRRRDNITPNDRMKIFVMYQVKKMSPNQCLGALQDDGRKDAVVISTNSVAKIAFELSEQLGIELRSSKTKKKKNRIIE